MAAHSYEIITSNLDGEDPNSIISSPAYANIMLNPPVEVGPGFTNAAIGQPVLGMQLEELLTNKDGTYFLAIESSPDMPNRQRMQRFEELGHRMTMLADAPERATLLVSTPLDINPAPSR